MLTKEIIQYGDKNFCIRKGLVLIGRVEFLFYDYFGMGFEKILVVKRDITYDIQAISQYAEFISIAEMPVDIHLLNGRIGSGMRGHGTISGFVRIK